MGLEQNSYNAHANSYSQTEIEKELAMYRNWFDRPTTDLWRHLRMLSVLNPFLKTAPNSNWLTIGDGRFGTSAIYITKNNGRALATDIDVTLLEVAKKEGMLKDFQFANAESLPFEDNQFDYSYCKAAYHHLPRPALAVYEMLRVSSKAIIFTEPQDFIPTPFTRRILQKTKHLFKRTFGIKILHHDTGNYEPIGNYVYGISVREFEKAALGLNLPCMAYKHFTDIYVVGVEKELQSRSAPLYKKIKLQLMLSQLKKWIMLDGHNQIQMIVFKQIPDKELENQLKKDGFTIVHFSANPYL